MNNSNALKTLVIYGLCIPLAIILGYMLTNPLSYETFGVVGLLAFLLVFPLIMKWHYPLLLLSWNMSLSGLFFLPGSPTVWLLLVILSIGMTIFERALSREQKTMGLPRVALPILYLGIVIIITAQLTGGFGFRALGSEVYGGKKYVYLLAALASYFALTSQNIPLHRAKLYVGFFFLGGLTNAVGDLFPITPKALEFIFWFFPPYSSVDQLQLGYTRLRGVGFAGFAAYCWMLAHFGIRNLFVMRKWWRMVIFLLVIVASFLGGFRSTLLAMVLIFTIQFFLEGLHRTRLLPVFGVVGILCGVMLIPFGSKLPFTFQRVLAVIPEDFLHLDHRARIDAEGSSRWRLELWESILPQVPQHLFLGKGYRITPKDFQMMGYDTSFKAVDASQQGLALAYEYHNGPLSVLIPFGIWGAVGFCWFLVAAFQVLIRNFRYGDPSLKVLNAFFLAMLTQKTIMFFSIFGSLDSDMVGFVGLVALNMSLNGGMAKKPVTEPVAAIKQASPRLLHPRPSFQR
jgi:hypothetical protein